MQHALRYYSTPYVDNSLVRIERDEEEARMRFVVDLGEEVVDPPSDIHVACLCRRMYAAHSTISPRCIYLYASGDDFETNALGAPLSDCPVVWSTFGAEHEEFDPLRLRITHMSHVAATLVQEYGNVVEATSFGFSRETYPFVSMSRALLALSVQRVHNPVTARHVLSVLCRSLDAPCLSVVFDKKLVLKVEESRHLDDNKVLIGTSTWMDYAQRTKSQRFLGRTEYLWVLRGDGCYNCAMKIVFLDHHWMESFDKMNQCCLSHRNVPDCHLVFYPQALSGGIVMLDYSEIDVSFPWWISEDMKRVPTELLMGVTRTKVRMREVTHENPVPLPLMDKRTKNVVKKWKKSSDNRGVHAPMLLCMVPLGLDDDMTLQSKTPSVLVAYRRRFIHDMNEKNDVADIFQGEFGKAYTQEVLSRIETISSMACYLVRDEENNISIGAFCVLLFECVLDDGTVTVAIMIDSFAVTKRCHGKGYGRTIFYDMVLPLAHRRLAQRARFLMFAQCIISKPGSDYWYDKLDESGDARALLFQVLTKYPECVSVQPPSCCTPRSRIYVVP